jgi:hypothetical protein
MLLGIKGVTKLTPPQSFRYRALPRTAHDLQCEVHWQGYEHSGLNPNHNSTPAEDFFDD